jgi:exopolyphosphatase/guanosine-5'-triphosphate,3'-diphosphate pyrophosphatase
VELAPDGEPMILLQEKLPVSLGQGSFADGYLTAQSMDRTVEALKSLTSTPTFQEADYVRAVATSALREARNKEELLDRARNDLGLDLKIVSGLEEARLIWAGVKANLNLGPAPCLIIDIGGGSLELIIERLGAEPVLDSLPLGAARLSERMGLSDLKGPIPAKLYRSVVEYVIGRIRRFTEHSRSYCLKVCWGCSGSLENLTRIYAKRKKDGDFDYQHILPVPTKEVGEIGLWLSSMSLEERRSVPGLDREKAQTIVAACAAAEAILTTLNVELLKVCPFGLKHGLVREFVEAFVPGAPRSAAAANEESVRRLGHRCLYDEEHALKVSQNALMIYDSFAQHNIFKPNDRDRELLRYGALLHDVGKFLSISSHQLHGWYLVRHANLLGFEDDECELIAYLVLAHRGPKHLKKNSLPELVKSLDSGPKNSRFRFLGFFCWLAEMLESRRQGGVESFKLKLDGHKVWFEVRAKNGTDLESEVSLFEKAAPQLENLFELKYAGALLLGSVDHNPY